MHFTRGRARYILSGNNDAMISSTYLTDTGTQDAIQTIPRDCVQSGITHPTAAMRLKPMMDPLIESTIETHAALSTSVNLPVPV
jgi:hypothetical protein